MDLVFKLRRTVACGHHINFHCDYAKKTLQVPLNDHHEYEGGEVVFANRNGLHIASRPAGSCTVHEGLLLHGVRPLVNGIRYGLFLLQN